MTAAATALRRPPGPGKMGPLDLVRFYRAMTSDALGTVGGRFHTYGDLYFTVSRGDPLYVTRHPDHARAVLVEQAAAFEKRSVDLEAFLGQGLLTANGDDWRRARRLIQPAFARPRLAAYADVMVEHAARLAADWRAGEVRDLASEMVALTLGIVCETLFGQAATPQADAIGAAMDQVQDSLTALDLLPAWVPTPLHRRTERARRVLDDAVLGLVRDRRAAGGGGDDLLGALVAAADEEGAIDDRLLRDQLVTLFLAGHETTSLALTWAIQLLVANPEAMATLRAESARVLGARAATLADLEALPYLGQVLDETMRLYPPAYAIPRLARAEAEIGGYRLEPGAEIIVWVYHLQRDARWFDDPNAFRPERFAADAGGLAHPQAYMPFGAGQRACIGRHFALFEAKLVLATLLQRGAFAAAGPIPVAPKPRITLGTGAPVRLRREA